MKRRKVDREKIERADRESRILLEAERHLYGVRPGAAKSPVIQHTTATNMAVICSHAVNGTSDQYGYMMTPQTRGSGQVSCSRLETFERPMSAELMHRAHKSPGVRIRGRPPFMLLRPLAVSPAALPCRSAPCF